MKALIIGGTGAMGSPLVQILLQKGYEVDVTSRKNHEDKTSDGVRYIVGDGHELSFIQRILAQNYYDSIIDFMTYTPDAFQQNISTLLEGTDRYIFLSSARVYADSKEPLTEESPRLLDIGIDESDFITDAYALSKAKEEDVLLRSGRKNWTIIRPYLTYNNYRLQLGVYEMQQWIPRALAGLSIVLPSDIAESITTMTRGTDVARIISHLIDNQKAEGEIIQIASEESMTWDGIAHIYKDVLTEHLGYETQIKNLSTSEELIGLWPKSLIKYDRTYNRKFCCDKLKSILGFDTLGFTEIRIGLSECLNFFLENQSKCSLYVNYEAWADRITKERSSIKRFDGYKGKILYIGKRYFI